MNADLHMLNVSEVAAGGGRPECTRGPVFVYFSYVLFAVILVPTVFGNLLILASIARFRHLRSNMHVLIGNLAVSDLLIAVSIILQGLGYIYSTLVTSRHYCLAQNAVFVISLGTSSYNLLSMSVERFVAVAYPFRHKTLFTRRTTLGLILVCWVYHVVLASLPIAGWNNYPDNATMACNMDVVLTREYDTLLFGGMFTVFVSNCVLCAVVVRIIVRKQRFRQYSAPAAGGNVGDLHPRGSSNQKLRRTKMTMIVFGVFALCWSPYLLVSFALVFHDTWTLRCLRQWCIFFGILNSALNWIIYGLANKSFRDAFKAVLRRQSVQSYSRDSRSSTFQ